MLSFSLKHEHTENFNSSRVNCIAYRRAFVFEVRFCLSSNKISAAAHSPVPFSPESFPQPLSPCPEDVSSFQEIEFTLVRD